MDKIKIGFITERMLLGHGVDLVIDKIACGLSSLNYDCEVFCNDYDETFKTNRPYKITRLAKPEAKNFHDLEQKTRKLSIVLNNRGIDLFIINTFPFYSLAGILNAPSIAINYGVVSTENIGLKRRLFYKYLDYTQNNLYFKKSSIVINISNFLKNKLPDKLKQDSAVIYLGSDHYSNIGVSPLQAGEFRSSLGVSNDDVLMLYAGRLNPVNQPYKGVEELLKIYKLAKNKNDKIKLLMIGYGSKNDEILLKNEGALVISNAPWDSMPLIYSSCDIYTTCSKWEGFDLPVVEAQYFGKPSIIYNIAAHPEVSENKKTGFLVNSKEEFLEKVVFLSENTEKRDEMGLYCSEFSKKFTWEKTSAKYDSIIKNILGGREQVKKYFKTPEIKTAGGEEKGNEEGGLLGPGENGVDLKNKNKLSVIIVNYNSSFDCLKECLDSLQSQSYKDFEVIIYDNASTNSTISEISDHNAKGSYSYKLKIIAGRENKGLAYAVNSSVKEADTAFILISNFDIVYSRTALEELMAQSESLGPQYLGLAPKIKFFYQKDYIESVGTYIDSSLYDCYLGLGQLDLHQYDVPEDIFGLSFTCALFKKDAFLKNSVGSVDETFFLFYEDFDFCFMANMMGYKFKSCPSSVVFHKYSYSFREESKAFETKYYYKRLNLLKMLLKNCENRTIKRILPIETKIMKSNLKDINLKNVSKKILADFKKSRKYLLKQRELLQLLRTVNDDEIIKYYWGEKQFFDVVKNEPKYEIENLKTIFQRLFVITGSNRYLEYVHYLQYISNMKFKFNKEILRSKLHSKLENEPMSVHNFIDLI